MSKSKRALMKIIPDETIIRRIYIFRGQKLMVDRDLAELYGIETKVLNQAVKRNIERFPKDFMFQLNVKEFENWRSQTVTSNLFFFKKSSRRRVRKLEDAICDLQLG